MRHPMLSRQKSLIPVRPIPKRVGSPLLRQRLREIATRRLTHDAEAHPPRRFRFFRQCLQGFSDWRVSSPSAGGVDRDSRSRGTPNLPLGFRAKVSEIDRDTLHRVNGWFDSLGERNTRL